MMQLDRTPLFTQTGDWNVEKAPQQFQENIAQKISSFVHEIQDVEVGRAQLLDAKKLVEYQPTGIVKPKINYFNTTSWFNTVTFGLAKIIAKKISSKRGEIFVPIKGGKSQLEKRIRAIVSPFSQMSHYIEGSARSDLETVNKTIELLKNALQQEESIPGIDSLIQNQFDLLERQISSLSKKILVEKNELLGRTFSELEENERERLRQIVYPDMPSLRKIDKRLPFS